MRPANTLYLIHPTRWKTISRIFCFLFFFVLLRRLFLQLRTKCTTTTTATATASATVALIESINIHIVSALFSLNDTASYLIIYYYWAVIFGCNTFQFWRWPLVISLTSHTRTLCTVVQLYSVHCTRHAFFGIISSTFDIPQSVQFFFRLSDRFSLHSDFRQFLCVCVCVSALLLFGSVSVRVFILCRNYHNINQSILSLVEAQNAVTVAVKRNLCTQYSESIFLFALSIVEMRRGIHWIWTRWPTIDQARTISCIHASRKYNSQFTHTHIHPYTHSCTLKFRYIKYIVRSPHALMLGYWLFLCGKILFSVISALH